MEWAAKRCYVGLVAVGVQEQAEDILVPPLLRNCLTNDISSPSHYLPPQNSGPCNSFYCLGHSKMSMMMMTSYTHTFNGSFSGTTRVSRY